MRKQSDLLFLSPLVMKNCWISSIFVLLMLFQVGTRFLLHLVFLKVWMVNPFRTCFFGFQSGPRGGGESGVLGIFLDIYGWVHAGNHKFQPNSSRDAPFQSENAMLVYYLQHDLRSFMGKFETLISQQWLVKGRIFSMKVVKVGSTDHLIQIHFKFLC